MHRPEESRSREEGDRKDRARDVHKTQAPAKQSTIAAPLPIKQSGGSRGWTRNAWIPCRLWAGYLIACPPLYRALRPQRHAAVGDGERHKRSRHQSLRSPPGWTADKLPVEPPQTARKRICFPPGAWAVLPPGPCLISPWCRLNRDISLPQVQTVPETRPSSSLHGSRSTSHPPPSSSRRPSSSQSQGSAQASRIPIILVPAASSSLINMFNVKALLERGEFKTAEQCKVGTETFARSCGLPAAPSDVHRVRLMYICTGGRGAAAATPCGEANSGPQSACLVPCDR